MTDTKLYGELVPRGGGDPIPLKKPTLRVGRRDSCDIVLNFSNISGSHCLLTLDEGYWFVKDLGSANGVKVNGVKLLGEGRKRLDPADLLTIAKHEYEVRYSPADNGAVGPPPQDESAGSIMKRSLLDRAGIRMTRNPEASRYDFLDPAKAKRKDS